jgi:autotransporter-associated beta strand protein
LANSTEISQRLLWVGSGHWTTWGRPKVANTIKLSSNRHSLPLAAHVVAVRTSTNCEFDDRQIKVVPGLVLGLFMKIVAARVVSIGLRAICIWVILADAALAGTMPDFAYWNPTNPAQNWSGANNWCQEAVATCNIAARRNAPVTQAIFQNPFFTNTITIDSSVNVGIITFPDVNKTQYIFSITPTGSLTLTSQGIHNGGGAKQTFVNNGSIVLQDKSSAASNIFFDNFNSMSFLDNSSLAGSSITNEASGSLTFRGSSNAGTKKASIINLGQLNFFDAGNAGQATINNQGTIVFNGSASGSDPRTTAGSATITNQAVASLSFKGFSSAGEASISNAGTTTFFDNSSAESATITNANSLIFTNNSSAASASITNNGTLEFNTEAAGGNAKINNTNLIKLFNLGNLGNATVTNSSQIEFFDTSSAGGAIVDNTGQLSFFGNSSGANATLNNSGKIFFQDFSTPATASIVNKTTTAVVDLSSATTKSVTAGSIAGAGTFFLGSNQLTVGSNNTPTIVSGVIADGGQFGGVGGSIVKMGSGKLTLNGQNTYTGLTVVDAGELNVNGSIAASSGLVIKAGAKISGNGAVPSLSSSGEISPGNSIGALKVDGNLTLGQSDLYFVELSAAADRITVTGTAALGGTVDTDFLPSGGAFMKQYNILHADGGFGGTAFSSVIAPANFLASLSYGATDVFLNLTPSLGLGSPLSTNESNVAKSIDESFNANGVLPPAFAALYDLSGSTLTRALTQDSGEVATGAQHDAFQLMNEFLGILHDPSFAASVDGSNPEPERRWNAWITGYGGSGSIDGDTIAGSHDVAAHMYGGAVGVDYVVTPETVLGFALAGAATSWRLSQGFGSGHSDVFQAGLYGNTYLDGAYASAALAFANHWVSTDRRAFGDDHLIAYFSAYGFAGRVEAGYPFALQAMAVTPFAALQAQDFHSPRYSETDLNAGGFGLAFNSADVSDTRSEIGAHLSTATELSGNAALSLRVSLAWAHDWVSDPALAATLQALPDSRFVVNGARPATDSALISAEGEIQLQGGWAVMGKFEGEFAGHSRTYAGSARIGYNW